MRNLKSYSGDSFIFFETVVSKLKTKKKKDLDYKNRIDSFKPNIKKLFSVFDSSFKKNLLETLVNHGYDQAETKDLNKLYKYKRKALKKLKDEIVTTATGRSIGICQYCTIGEVNSFDHILPKKKFAEYSVHPKNLFPCCSTCNSHKKDSNSTTRAFLNLYIDILPNKQFLFAKLNVINKTTIKVKFFIDNQNGVDKDMFALIESHFKKLHLCDRFPNHINDEISDLFDDIENYLDEVPLTNAIDLANRRVKKEKKAYGFNFWPSVLKEELLKDKKFLALF